MSSSDTTKTESNTFKSTMSLSDYTAFKKEYPYASEADFRTYKMNKQKLFKSSIILCVVYGVFALTLLLLTLFVPRVKDFLAGDFLAFIVTLVIGMVLIIIMVIIMIVTFKPVAFSNGIYDQDMCPDYWKFVPVDPNEIPTNPNLSDTDKYLMKYKCVPKNSIYNIKSPLFDVPSNTPNQKNIYGQSINVNRFRKASEDSSYAVPFTSNDNGTAIKKFRRYDKDNMSDGKGYADLMYGEDTIKCDKVFPNFLAAKDAKEFPNHPNQLRCAYAKKCGIPWTSICPEKETDFNTNF